MEISSNRQQFGANIDLRTLPGEQAVAVMVQMLQYLLLDSRRENSVCDGWDLSCIMLLALQTMCFF